jgi:hypothetical protein
VAHRSYLPAGEDALVGAPPIDGTGAPPVGARPRRCHRAGTAKDALPIIHVAQGPARPRGAMSATRKMIGTCLQRKTTDWHSFEDRDSDHRLHQVPHSVRSVASSGRASPAARDPLLMVILVVRRQQVASDHRVDEIDRSGRQPLALSVAKITQMISWRETVGTTMEPVPETVSFCLAHQSFFICTAKSSTASGWTG